MQQKTGIPGFRSHQECKEIITKKNSVEQLKSIFNRIQQESFLGFNDISNFVLHIESHSKRVLEEKIKDYFLVLQNRNISKSILLKKCILENVKFRINHHKDYKKIIEIAKKLLKESDNILLRQYNLSGFEEEFAKTLPGIVDGHYFPYSEKSFERKILGCEILHIVYDAMNSTEKETYFDKGENGFYWEYLIATHQALLAQILLSNCNPEKLYILSEEYATRVVLNIFENWELEKLPNNRAVSKFFSMMMFMEFDYKVSYSPFSIDSPQYTILVVHILKALVVKHLKNKIPLESIEKFILKSVENIKKYDQFSSEYFMSLILNYFQSIT